MHILPIPIGERHKLDPAQPLHMVVIFNECQLRAVLSLRLSHRQLPELFCGGYGWSSHIAAPGGIALEDEVMREGITAVT